MKVDKLLSELKDHDMEDSEDTQDNDNEIKTLINSDTAFKGRITKPTVISFKYKELSEALSEASGLTINRIKAKAMFDAFRKIMGI